MKTEYNGIEIVYDEAKDRWLFDLRGRSRSADSLAKAKEAIDKEPKRAQTFPRFQAYCWSYRGREIVTVTSVADDGYGKHEQFWVSKSGNGRSKEHISGLYPVNDHNTAIVSQIDAEEREIKKLKDQIEKLRESLQRATVPADIS